MALDIGQREREGIVLLVGLMYAAMAAHLIPTSRAENGRIMESGELWTLAAVFLALVAFHRLIEYHHSLRVIRTFLPESNTRT